MIELLIVTFIIGSPLIWAICDRLREIAIFPRWVSIFGGWWDRYFTPEKKNWNPFRDGYHFWKNAAIFLYCAEVGICIGIEYNWVYGVTVGLFSYGFWAVGQSIGLLFKRDKINGSYTNENKE